MSPRALASLLLCMPACGPALDVEPMSADASGATAPSLTETAGEATGGGAPGGSTATDPGTDSGGPAPGYEDDDGGTGCTFTCPDPLPPGPTPGPGSGPGGGCDLFEQWCPEGEKCMPWDAFGEGSWNATRCSPIEVDPGAPGEPCTVEGNAFTGIDSCAFASVCWQVDPDTNTGICYSLCAGDQSFPICEPSFSCVLAPGDVPLCVQACDPVAPSCLPDQGCQLLPGDDSFVCQPVPERSVPVGEVCDDPYACAVGSLCAFGSGIDCGNGPGQGCCAEICEVGSESCSSPGAACLPWIPLDPPPSLAHIGVCSS